MEPIDIGISLNYRIKGFFHGKMNDSTGYLLLNATDNRSGQHNIANRTQPDDEDLFQSRFFYKSKTSALNSPNFVA